MTPLNMDWQKRVTGLVPVVGMLLWACAGLAMAEVNITNKVQKVETYVDEEGVAQRRLVDADSVIPGDELRYTIEFTNRGEDVVDAGSIVITNPIPQSTVYVDGTAFGSGTQILFSIDDGATFATPAQLSQVSLEQPRSAKDYTTIRWQFEPVLTPGETGHVSFNVRLK